MGLAPGAGKVQPNGTQAGCAVRQPHRMHPAAADPEPCPFHNLAPELKLRTAAAAAAAAGAMEGEAAVQAAVSKHQLEERQSAVCWRGLMQLAEKGMPRVAKMRAGSPGLNDAGSARRASTPRKLPEHTGGWYHAVTGLFAARLGGQVGDSWSKRCQPA